MPRTTRKWPARRIQEIYAGLVRLLESGLKPVEALRRLGLEESKPDPFFASAAEAIEKGATLAAAFEEGAPGAFPERDLAMLEAAEIKGTRIDTLRRLMNDHRRRSAVTRRFVRKILFLALFVHAAAAACVVFLAAGRPAGFGVAGLCLCLVPFYTLFLAGWFLYRRYWAGIAPREMLAPYPFAMNIIMDSELGNFFRLTCTLFGAGTALEEAVRRAADLIRTQSLRGRVIKATEPLGRGEPFAACLKEIGLPDETYLTRLAIGEEAGELEEALKETGEGLSERAQKQAAALFRKIAVLLCLLALLGVLLTAAAHFFATGS